MWGIAFGNGGLAGSRDTLFAAAARTGWRGASELGVHGLLGRDRACGADVTRVALQLWTLRHECEADLHRALLAIGALGYDGVELFGLNGHDAPTVRGCSTKPASSRAAATCSSRTIPARSQPSSRFSARRVAAIAWIDPDRFARPDAAAASIAAAADSARDAGFALGFHNHWSELEPSPDGGTFLDRLRALPADLLWLELDLGWAWSPAPTPQPSWRPPPGGARPCT